MSRSCYKEFTFTWIIKNYYEYNLSSIFIAKNIDKTRWSVYFDIGNIVEEQSVSFSLYKESSEAVTLDIEMELCDSQKVSFCTTEKEKGVRFGEEVDSYDFPPVPLSEKMKNQILESSTLIVRCKMGANSDSQEIKYPFYRSCTMKTTQCWDESSSVIKLCSSKDPHWSSMFTFAINKRISLNVNIKAPEEDILFEISSDKNFDQIVKSEITLLKEDGEKIISRKDLFSFYSCKLWCYPPFLKRSFLEKVNGDIYLKYNFSIQNYHRFHESIDEAKLVNLTTSIKDDLRKMLFSEEYADVSFRVDSELYSAHKNILASRSPVFSAKFRQEMLENQTGVIEISDMDVQTLKLFLEFVYTEELKDLDWEKALDLLLAADKYQVPSLKEKCSEFLYRHISSDNVCNVVSVADMVGEKTLKETAIDYIKENVAKIFASPKWSVFVDKNVQLCSEIFYNFSEDLKLKHSKI